MYGMVCDHAYELDGCIRSKEAGKILIKVRNVWGIDTWKGPYCDDKIKNNAALLKELGH